MNHEDPKAEIFLVVGARRFAKIVVLLYALVNEPGKMHVNL